MDSEFTDLETLIRHDFRDKSLLELALTHPSCQLKNGDNQRLEFLGDSVLGLVIANILYNRHPNAEEGHLDRMRAGVVNGSALAARAKKLGINDQLRVSKAHAQHLPKPSDSMLEDAIEALIGAVFLDGGLNAAETVILHILEENITQVSKNSFTTNPKGELQEWSQAHYEGATPQYITRAKDGPDHAKVYTVAVLVDGKEIAKAEASSVKAAEIAAAKAALVKTR